MSHRAKCLKTSHLYTALSVPLKNAPHAYGIAKQLKFDVINHTQKHLLYKQFIAWNIKGDSIAPLTDYINNPIFLELLPEDNYFMDLDERIYLNVRDSSGYTNQKLRQNDSDLVFKIGLKNPLSIKMS